jgi:hypothetical protein
VTSGTDELGRTPLHLAAHCGATPEVIDAIVRADPAPATMGDVDKRSPLHLVMRRIAYDEHYQSRNDSQLVTPSSKRALDGTCQTVLILKDAMLTYPGRIDFKDEDDTGFSPLDYGLDGNISKEELLHSLIRRKEPRVGKSSSSSATTTNNNSNKRGKRRASLTRRPIMMRRMASSSSISCDDQDIEVLRRLEQDEIEARKRRIQKLKSRKKKAVMNDALFDVFGIEEQPAAAAAPAGFVSPREEQEEESPLQPPQHQQTDKVEGTTDAEPVDHQAKTKPQDQPEPNVDVVGMTDEAIYDKHLQDYLDEYMDDFVEGGDLEYCDEDAFDILEDPSEVRRDQEQEQAALFAFRIEDSGEINAALPAVIILSDNYEDDEDECASVISEITVPLSR